MICDMPIKTVYQDGFASRFMDWPKGPLDLFELKMKPWPNPSRNEFGSNFTRSDRIKLKIDNKFGLFRA